ncbi:two-component response regulator-like APRR5 [Henckelia pumila]|uniref:two-component response regulator-like APRR5 n=1 Tax=Henckelia pumila TaxID=405737 RepID=UPI003C6E7FAE
MEHDACKNILVIMMSLQDSIRYCLQMPVRKNELKNLSQHFWSKQASSSADNDVPDESVVQHKVEETAEKKANGNRS